MAMSEARRNEIAWQVVAQRLREKGISHLKPNEFQREIFNGAKKMGISKDEAMEFAKELIIPLVNEIFILPEEKSDDGHNFFDGVESGPRN
jgi:hypothetical protein